MLPLEPLDHELVLLARGEARPDRLPGPAGPDAAVSNINCSVGALGARSLPCVQVAGGAVDVIVGLDLGTTACKVTVVRSDLTTKSVSSSPYGISAPQRGWAEQDPLGWGRAVDATLLHALGIAPDTAVEDRFGRPIRVCEGAPITALFG